MASANPGQPARLADEPGAFGNGARPIVADGRPVASAGDDDDATAVRDRHNRATKLSWRASLAWWAALAVIGWVLIFVALRLAGVI